MREGQRIVNGMQDILKLYLTRIIYIIMLIIATGFLTGFPFSPKHSSLVALLAVGIPTLALAAWSRPAPVPHTSMLRRLMHFVLPASILQCLFGLGVYLAYMIPAYQSLITAYPAVIPSRPSTNLCWSGKLRWRYSASFAACCCWYLSSRLHPGGRGVRLIRRPPPGPFGARPAGCLYHFSSAAQGRWVLRFLAVEILRLLYHRRSLYRLGLYSKEGMAYAPAGPLPGSRLERKINVDKHTRDIFTDDILSAALRCYNIDPISLQLLGGFESFIYAFTRDGKEYILRLSHSMRFSLEMIEAEVDWVNYLSE